MTSTANKTNMRWQWCLQVGMDLFYNSRDRQFNDIFLDFCLLRFDYLIKHWCLYKSLYQHSYTYTGSLFYSSKRHLLFSTVAFVVLLSISTSIDSWQSPQNQANINILPNWESWDSPFSMAQFLWSTLHFTALGVDPWVTDCKYREAKQYHSQLGYVILDAKQPF